MRPLHSVLALVLFLSFGCGDKVGDGEPTSPMTVEVVTPTSPQTGNISIGYNLIDSRLPPLSGDVTVDYSVDGGSFSEATVGTGGPGTTNLTASALPGTPHTFLWDSITDIGVGTFSVRIRMTPYDTGTDERGIDDTSDPFQVINTENYSPMIVVVTTPPSPQTGDVSVGYNLIDTRIPTLNGDVTVEYSTDGTLFQEATASTGGEGTTNLASSALPGTPHTFVWDTITDLGLGVFSVTIRMTPYDTGTDDVGTDDTSDAFDVINAEYTAAALARVMDPKLPGDSSVGLQYRMDPAGVDSTWTVTVLSGGTEIRRLVDAQVQPGGTDHVVTWDGLDSSGVAVDTGTYEVVFESVSGTLPPWTGTDTVHVVRLGVVGVEFGSNGTGSAEYQLMYHIRNTSLYSYWAIPDSRPQWAIGPEAGELADLDTDDGRARRLPAMWTDTYSPPQDSMDTAGVEDDNYNLPACYHRAATPRFQVTVGTGAVSMAAPGTAMGCGYPITGLPIRMLASGAAPEGASENIWPGEVVTFVSSSPLPDGLRVNTLDLTFSFEYQDGGEWHPIPGSIPTQHTLYTIYDRPTLSTVSSPTPPYVAWVALVDLVCRWVAGPATAEEVTGTVTSMVNSFFGLQYDTRWGACHYTTGSESNHTMQMTEFLDDYDSGTFTTLNCSDCACLQTTFANAVGVDHQYEILGLSDRIPLNYMIPIGRSWMVPFSGSFRYHAVSTMDDGASISDACATLDDDSDPSSPPHVPILPVNMSYTTYKEKLSPDPTSWGTYTRARCAQR